MGEWFEIPKIFVTIGGVWVLVSVWGIVGRWRKGFWRLGFKEALQSIIRIGGILWVMYFILTSVLFLDPLGSWLTVYIEGEEWSKETLWILNSIPIFYVISILLIACWILGKAFSYKPKYSEEEKAFLKDGRLKMKKRLGWFGRFIKVD